MNNTSDVSTQAYELVEGFEKIIDKFGLWPSFHDGEILRIVLDRTSRSQTGSYIPTVEIHIRCYVMTTGDGPWKIHNDSVVRLMFEDVFDCILEGFNHQNVLSSLNLSIIDDPTTTTRAIHVELEHCYLFSGELSARRAKVLEVTPFIP